MKCKTVCFVALILCVILLVFKLRDKKQDVYISFQNLQGYSYTFERDSMGNLKTIILRQEGRLNYKHWELDIDNTKIERKESLFVLGIDVVSQFWIINNFTELKIVSNPPKASNYNINVIRHQGDSLFVYPISHIHYIVE